LNRNDTGPLEPTTARDPDRLGSTPDHACRRQDGPSWRRAAPRGPSLFG